jgi:hypothetical protein
LILAEATLEELDGLRQRWDHEIHSLASENRADEGVI